MKGIFVTMEGCEGSGKSTQLRLLAERLDGAGIKYIMTREPGGSEIAERIREIILDGKNTAMCDECEALLYAAARVQHLKEVVIPALKEGTLVICDRYVDSSLAYQGVARGLGEEYVAEINSFALRECPPDLTIFLNIPPRSAFARKHGADKDDRIEQMGEIPRAGSKIDFNNLTIEVMKKSSCLYDTRIGAEPHRSALPSHIPLLVHEVYNAFISIRVKLTGICIRQPRKGTGCLDHSDLHSKTYAKIRNVILTGIARTHYHALNSPAPESSWNENAINIMEERFRTFSLHLLGVDEEKFKLRIIPACRMIKSLID